jgi:hypothetical protein
LRKSFPEIKKGLQIQDDYAIISNAVYTANVIAYAKEVKQQ